MCQPVNQSESETKIGNLTQEREKTRVIASDWSEKQYAFFDWLIHDTLKQTNHYHFVQQSIRIYCISILGFLYFCSNQWVGLLYICGYYPLHVTASPVGLKKMRWFNFTALFHAAGGIFPIG